MEARTKRGYWFMRAYLPESWRKEMKRYALEHDTTVQDVVIAAIEHWAQFSDVALPPRKPEHTTHTTM
jgi:NRPS condensation-like uncharacterized protein